MTKAPIQINGTLMTSLIHIATATSSCTTSFVIILVNSAVLILSICLLLKLLIEVNNFFLRFVPYP